MNLTRTLEVFRKLFRFLIESILQLARDFLIRKIFKKALDTRGGGQLLYTGGFSKDVIPMRAILDEFISQFQTLISPDDESAKVQFEVTNILVIQKSMIIEGYFQNNGSRPAHVTNLKLDINLLDEHGEKIWNGIISTSEITKNLVQPNQLSLHILQITDANFSEIKSKFTWIVNSQIAQEFDPIL